LATKWFSCIAHNVYLRQTIPAAHYKHQDDDIDDSCNDDISGAGILDFGDDISLSTKRTMLTTMAGATVGKKQRRSPGKRPHNPTNRLGVNVAIKDQQVLYATENRSLKDNRQLLMVPGFRSKTVPDAGSLAVLPLSDQLIVSTVVADQPLVPVVDDAQLPTESGGSHQQTAVVESSMSAAPFASSRGTGGEEGDDDDDDSSSYHGASIDGPEDDHSESASVYSDYNGSKAGDALLLDIDVNFSY